MLGARLSRTHSTTADFLKRVTGVAYFSGDERKASIELTSIERQSANNVESQNDEFDVQVLLMRDLTPGTVKGALCSNPTAELPEPIALAGVDVTGRLPPIALYCHVASGLYRLEEKQDAILHELEACSVFLSHCHTYVHTIATYK